MLLLAVILVLLLLLFLLLLFTPTLLGVDYLYENKKQKLKIRARLLGIPFYFTVPLDKKKKKQKPEAEKKPLTPKKFIEFAKNLHEGYQEVKDEIRKLLSDIKQGFGCKDVYCTVHYGTKNPATTGMLNGAIWAASSLLLKVIDEAVGAKKKTLEVYPDFQNACMCLHIKGTFCFKLFDAIRFALKIKRLVNIIKSHVSAKPEAENVS